MRFLRKEGAVMVMLGAIILTSSLCPVQAAETAAGSEPGTAYSVEGSVSGGDIGSKVRSTEDSGSTEADNHESGEDSGEQIIPYDLTIYPDDRVTQWNMGNSSGKYGNSFDSYAVFDDNIIAALYDLGNDTYRLELTGSGEMAGPGGRDYQPYRAYRNKIVSVVVGEGITNVGKNAFARFSNLQVYTLPSSVKVIGESAFEYCTSLKAVVIPDTVDSLSHYCFQHCSAVTSLTIPGDLEYNDLYIPFYDMSNLTDIYITPGKTGAASVAQMTYGNPANKSDGYTIHFMEGVTEIHDKVFANTKASRIEIANSVTIIGLDAFAKDAFDKSTIPDYIVLGDNTRRIAAKAFMASVETITPTTVEIGNVYQYEYDWVAVRRDVTFVVRLNALKELKGMVEEDIADGTLPQQKYPAAKWKELQEELARAGSYVEEAESDLDAVTDCFTRLYDLYHYEITASYVVSVPASLVLTDDPEGGRIVGELPITVRYLFPDNTWQLSVTVDKSSLSMQEKSTGSSLPLTVRTEGNVWSIDSEGASVDEDGFYCGSGKVILSGERAAGDWEGILRLNISCGQ